MLREFKTDYLGKSEKSELCGDNQTICVNFIWSLIGLTFVSHYTLSHENSSQFDLFSVQKKAKYGWE